MHRKPSVGGVHWESDSAPGDFRHQRFVRPSCGEGPKRHRNHLRNTLGMINRRDGGVGLLTGGSPFGEIELRAGRAPRGQAVDGPVPTPPSRPLAIHRGGIQGSILKMNSIDVDSRLRGNDRWWWGRTVENMDSRLRGNDDAARDR